MTIKELQEKLKALKADMGKLIEKENMTEEEAKSFDDLEAEAVQVKANIERIERFEAAKAKDEEGEGRKAKPIQFFSVTENVDPQRGFKNLADLATAIRSETIPGANRDHRLKLLSAPTGFHKEGGSAEGYEVPAQFKNEIFDLVFNEPDLLSMVDSEPTNSNAVQIVADESTPWGATGIQANWAGEGTQLTPSSLETSLIDVKLHKLYAFCLATDELLSDSARLNSRLTMGAARAINWEANKSIFYGTGAGQPLGFFPSSTMVAVAKESGQAADTVVAANVAKMYARSTNPGRSVWVMNQDVLPQLITMQIGNNAAWTAPQSGMANAPGGFLMGRPILFSDQCKTLGDKGDIMFIDPMGYYSPRKSDGVVSDTSIHLYFDYGIQAFRWTFRMGGQPYQSKVVTPANGSSTRSAFVSIADRA